MLTAVAPVLILQPHCHRIFLTGMQIFRPAAPAGIGRLPPQGNPFPGKRTLSPKSDPHFHSNARFITRTSYAVEGLSEYPAPHLYRNEKSPCRQRPGGSSTWLKISVQKSRCLIHTIAADNVQTDVLQADQPAGMIPAAGIL